MAVGPDRVQVLKRESAALGGDGADDADYLEPIGAQEDAIECAGVYLQDAANRDETTYVAREGADMVFADQNNPVPVTLTELLATGGGSGMPTPTQVGQVLICAFGATFTSQLPLTSTETGWLIDNDGVLMVVG
jgi:hypothetical protein